MLLSRQHNVGQNQDTKIANRSFENVSQFKYLGTTVTNQNLIQEEIKRRLNSVQNLLSSRLLSKNLKIRIYLTIILTVVLYRCEIWSLALKEAHRLGVFENRVLRIFGPKRDEVTGEWRKLHNEELHDLYSSTSIIRTIKSRMRWVGHVARVGERRHAYRLLVGKRPLGRPRRRWVNNIRVDLVEVEWGDVEWIGLAQDRDRWRVLVNSVLSLQSAGKLWGVVTTRDLLSSAQLHS
jgi:hypothetical protein